MLGGRFVASPEAAFPVAACLAVAYFAYSVRFGPLDQALHLVANLDLVYPGSCFDS